MTNLTKVTTEEIDLAFRKLQTSVYYDKSNLLLRKRVADFTIQLESNQNRSPLKNIEKALNEDKNILDNWLNKIALVYYPKKIKSKVTEQKSTDNFISNKIYNGTYSVERLAIFADMPIELYIIDVLWVMRYGICIDKKLSDCCYGNRLAFSDKNKTSIKTRWIYKKYINQYQDWWGNGLYATNAALHNDKSDVTLITLDISDYYHSVRFSLDNLAKEVQEENLSISDCPIWSAFTNIYHKYWRIAKDSGIDLFNTISNDTTEGPLPISLSSSPIIANWYLNAFDEYISNEYNCIYYGRYVDDMLFVMKRDGENEMNRLTDAISIYFSQIFREVPNTKNTDYKFNDNISSTRITDELNNQLKNHLKTSQSPKGKTFLL